jgi:alpha-L-arabinofuranosidase
LSSDEKVLALQVVNIGDRDQPARIHVDGFGTQSAARILELTGEMAAVNTAEHPDRIAPKEKSLAAPPEGKDTFYVFPARSFTVIHWTR